MKNKFIKSISVFAFIIGLGSSIALAQQSPNTPSSATTTTKNGEVNWREEYAYHLGMQAYVYGFPAIYYAKLRFGMVERPMGRVNTPINTFFHMPLVDATDQIGGSPNNDTNYSLAWVDLRQEAMVVETPATNRFLAIEFADFYSDSFAYSGASVNQGRAEKVLLVGPNWRGAKPRGVSRIIRSPSNWALLVSRDFWSITMYDARYNLVANPISRYAINNKTEGMKYNADGSLDIFIQPDRPEGERAANWLPSKAGEPFNLFLRAYGPGASILNQTYVPPSVAKATN